MHVCCTGENIVVLCGLSSHFQYINSHRMKKLRAENQVLSHLVNLLLYCILQKTKQQQFVSHTKLNIVYNHLL